MPHLTEARCRACTILGGCKVTNERTRAAVSKLRELLEERVEIGDEIELPPCLPEHALAIYEEQLGRPCPRVELEPANVEAMRVCQLLLRDDARPAFAEWFAAVLGDEPAAVRQRVLDRALGALADESVMAIRYPKLPE